MKVHKKRIPVDYVHNEFDVMGYINHYEVTEDGLVLTGALVPWKESDRAAEVIHKSREGVPYEASIASSFDGMIIEEVPGGASVEVNGRTFDGPLVVFRQWHLRGVAICPYGADMNTASEFKKTQGKADAVPVKFEGSPAQEKKQMPSEETKPEETKSAESSKDVEAETPETKPAESQEDDSTKDVDAGKDAVQEAADGKAAESGKDVEAPKKSADSASEMTAGRSECARFVAAFGDKGGQWFAEGKTFEEASKLHYDSLAAENAELKTRLSAAGEGEIAPVEFQPEQGGKADKPGRFSHLPDGLARFAGGITLPQHRKAATA